MVITFHSCNRYIDSKVELSVLGSTGPLCTALPPQLVAESAAQSKLCALFGDHMPAVKRGALLALDECQWQFRQQRWNCSLPAATATTETPTPTTGDNNQRSVAAVSELLAPSITIGDNQTRCSSYDSRLVNDTCEKYCQ